MLQVKTTLQRCKDDLLKELRQLIEVSADIRADQIESICCGAVSIDSPDDVEQLQSGDVLTVKLRPAAPPSSSGEKKKPTKRAADDDDEEGEDAMETQPAAPVQAAAASSSSSDKPAAKRSKK